MLTSETAELSILGTEYFSTQVHLFQFWSNATAREPHMLTQTANQLRSSCRAAAVLHDHGDVVGIAGLFEARTRAGEPIQLHGRTLMEIGSAYVLPERRNHGLGNRLLRSRLAYAQAQDWPVVCITTNPAIQHLCDKYGGTQIDEVTEYHWLRHELCVCSTISAACKVCPHAARATWLWLPTG